VSANLTYTKPADIDGEPVDVRELSLQQLGEALAQIVTLSEETFTQLRAEGVGREGEDWDASEDAEAAESVCRNLRQSLVGVNRLQQAE
jgi:hypothetical protein